MVFSFGKEALYNLQPSLNPIGPVVLLISVLLSALLSFWGQIRFHGEQRSNLQYPKVQPKLSIMLLPLQLLNCFGFANYLAISTFLVHHLLYYCVIISQLFNLLAILFFMRELNTLRLIFTLFLNELFEGYFTPVCFNLYLDSGSLYKVSY